MIWGFLDDARFLISLPHRRAQDLVGQLRFQLAARGEFDVSNETSEDVDWPIPSYSGPPRWVLDEVAQLRDRGLHRSSRRPSSETLKSRWTAFLGVAAV